MLASKEQSRVCSSVSVKATKSYLEDSQTNLRGT